MYVTPAIQWSPSNPDTFGIRESVQISKVLSFNNNITAWVWLIAKIDDVRLPMTPRVRHMAVANRAREIAR